MFYFVLDFLAALASGITVTLLFQPVQFDIGLYFNLVFSIAVLFSVSNFSITSFVFKQRDSILTVTFSVLISVAFCFLLITSYLFLIKQGSTYSRGWFVLTCTGIVLYSILLRTGFAAFQRRNSKARNVVIVGTDDLSITLHRRMQESIEDSFIPLAFCNLNGQSPKEIKGLPVLSGISELLSFIESGRRGELDSSGNLHVEEVWITLPLLERNRLLELQKVLRNTATRVYYVPRMHDLGLKKYHLDTLFNLPVMEWTEVKELGLKIVLKRFIDIVFSMIALIALSPLMLSVAVGIYLFDRGDILFKQKRYGLDGKEFTLLKFRSMKPNQKESSEQMLEQVKINDSRVTLIGRFIRKYSIDELPQLLNILRGDMSLVGPRPHASEHNEYYREKIDGYMSRHRMKPGLTGWAQVNGYRGETPELADMQNRVLLDLAYIENWSPLMDFKILLRTIFVILTAKNAY